MMPCLVKAKVVEALASKQKSPKMYSWDFFYLDDTASQPVVDSAAARNF